MRRWHVLLLLAAAFPSAAAAQDTTTTSSTTGTVLTLSDALAQARQHSPVYLQTLNNAGPASAGVRNAYGQFIPSVTVGAGLGYTGSGQSQFGGTLFQQSSPSYSSSYDISLGWQLNGQVLTGPALQKAQQRATTMDIAAAGLDLETNVKTQYLTALQAVAQVDVARQQLKRDTTFLQIAQARYDVGQATLLDVRQAEVGRDNSEVALLRAEQAANEAKLELLRQIGVEAPTDVEQLQLRDTFTVSEPDFSLDQLLSTAADANPTLRALQARADAAGSNLTAAKSEWFPTLSVRAGWSGFTQQFSNTDILLSNSLGQAQGAFSSCQQDNEIRTRLADPLPPRDCYTASGLQPDGTLDPVVAQSILDQNNVFPFHYTRNPFSASLSLSFPVFNGFGRSLRIAEARAQREDADQGVRAQRLLVRSTVQARYLAVRTAYRAIAVQTTARSAARDQLQLAQDRYRLGSGTALELADAQNAVQKAEADYVNAIYDFHKAVAQLEAAVGRPLR